MRKYSALALVTLAAVAIACGKKSEPVPQAPPAEPPPVSAPQTTTTDNFGAAVPVAVNNVTFGNAIGADKRVLPHPAGFSVKDKIYASVETIGAGHAKLRGLWSFVQGDKTAKVNETVLEFDATGPAVNEFHIENSKDWPKGDYRFEVFLNDATTPAASGVITIE